MAVRLHEHYRMKTQAASVKMRKKTEMTTP